MTNVSPYVEGRTLSRDEFTVWTSENSPSQAYEDKYGRRVTCFKFSYISTPSSFQISLPERLWRIAVGF